MRVFQSVYKSGFMAFAEEHGKLHLFQKLKDKEVRWVSKKRLAITEVVARITESLETKEVPKKPVYYKLL